MTQLQSNHIEDYTKQNSMLIIKESMSVQEKHITLGKSSYLKLAIINEINQEEEAILKLSIELEENATLELTMLYIGKGKNKEDITIYLNGDGSRCDLKAGYLIGEQTIHRMAYDVFHKGKRTVSNVIVKGALQDEAHKYFKGNLYFKQGAKGSKGSEIEDAILLSPSAKSYAVPALWCDEDDIMGNHSASSGKLSKDKLFYLMSRGLSEEQSKCLMVEAELAPILREIEEVKVRERISDEISRRIGK